MHIRSVLPPIVAVSLLACGGPDSKSSQPHAAVTLLAGVDGYLSTCNSLRTDRTLTQKHVIEFAPIGRSFAQDRVSLSGAPEDLGDKLAQRQAALVDCVDRLERQVGIGASAR